MQALRGLGDLSKDLGLLQEAMAQYQRSLDLSELLPDKYMVAVVLDSLARCAKAQGQFEKARELYERAAAQSFDELEAAYTNHSLSLMLRHDLNGEEDTANRLDAESLRIARERGELNLTNALLGNLVNRETQSGNHQLARELVREMSDNLAIVGRDLETTCAICLNEEDLLCELADGDSSLEAIYIAPYCYHVFHKACHDRVPMHKQPCAICC